MRQQQGRSHGCPLKDHNIAIKRFPEGVPGHVKKPEAELPHASITLVIGQRLLQFYQQFIRDLLSCLPVCSPGVEPLFLPCPVLQYLRRQLHKIALHVGACQALIGAVRQHAVQRMTELVEEGVHLTVGE